MIIVIINGCMGFFQEQKAEKSLEKLKELSAPVIRVLRNGEWQTVPSEEAVVGDVIKITSGDRVPADIRIVKARDRKSTRLNSSHVAISYAVFCLKKKINQITQKTHRKKRSR